MLNSIFSNSQSIDLASLLIASLVSLFLGIIISLTHKYTSNYNKNFLITLSVLPLIVETVIMTVNGNLGTSVAVLGAFSLVRFRSIPGNSKEILSVFFSMAIGLICGVGYIYYACLITIIGCISLLLLNNIKIFDKNKYEKILRITIPENLDYTDVFNDIFKKYLNDYKLEQVKTTNMGSMFELNYRIKLNKEINEKEFIDELRVKNGNLKIIISHPVEGEL